MSELLIRAIGGEEFIPPADLNHLWRASLFQGLTGADKVSLAGYLGVSVRTVQRWTTLAGEQRNPFPLRLTDVPFEDWPETYQRRAAVTRRIVYGGVSENLCEPPTAEFGQVRGTLAAADVWAELLEGGGIDPWLDEAWCSYRIERTERGWEVRVVYSTVVSSGAQRTAQ